MSLPTPPPPPSLNLSPADDAESDSMPVRALLPERLGRGACVAAEADAPGDGALAGAPSQHWALAPTGRGAQAPVPAAAGAVGT